MTELVALELGAVATLRLTNPPLNLVTLELTASLEDKLERLQADPDVRAVVVAGNERAFCAGSDIKEFEGLHGRVGEGKLIREGAVYTSLSRLPMPTIAAIEGNALGGGLELALCCDIRVVSETALLGLPEVRLGAIPGSGGTQRLPRLVGPGRAKEMIFSGEPVTGARAAEIGLVQRVVPAGQAESESRALAEVIAGHGPRALRAAKRAIDEGLDSGLEAGLALELEGSEEVFSSADLLEGAHAFFDKRTPRFSGR